MKREEKPPTDFQGVFVRLIDGGKGWAGYPKLLARPLKLLAMMVGLVLLIACANVANLLLARGAARRREMGVRLALGCGRGRLVRQMLTESVLLAFIGAALGLLVAQWGIRFLDALLLSSEEPIVVWVATDWRVLSFTAGIAILTGVLFGIAPALRACQTPAASSLLEGGSRSVAGGRLWLSRTLVVAQVAFSIVVLVTAALLVRSLWNLRAIDTGFNRSQVLSMQVNEWVNPAAKSLTPDRLRGLLQRLESVPGVQSASFSAWGVMAGARMNTQVSHQDLAPSAQQVRLRFSPVSANYFRTLGARIVYGREFTLSDAGPNARVAILSRTAARRLFANEAPLGKWLSPSQQFDAAKALEVVGIVEDARVDGLRTDAVPMLYTPLLRSGGNFLSAEFRVAAPAAAVVPAIRKILDEESILIRDVHTLEDRADSTIALDRTLAALAAAFGVLALIVVTVGLYGLLAYSTTRRTAEFGVRLAFGARSSQIASSVLKEAVRLVVLGLAIGLPVAMAAARLTRSTLYGIEPTDPLAVAASALLVVAAAPLASLFPAWRASRIEPATALRHD
jgi:predicted permease